MQSSPDQEQIETFFIDLSVNLLQQMKKNLLQQMKKKKNKTKKIRQQCSW